MPWTLHGARSGIAFTSYIMRGKDCIAHNGMDTSMGMWAWILYRMV